MDVSSDFISRHSYQLNNTYRVNSEDPIYDFIIDSKNFNKIAGGNQIKSKFIQIIFQG